MVGCIKLISQNVRVFQARARRIAILNYLASRNCDIICIQEAGLNRMPKKNEWRYGEAFWSFTTLNKNDGIGVLIQNKEMEVKNCFIVEEGRCMILTLLYRGCEFKLINIYANAVKKERLLLFEKLKFFLQGKLPTIIAGDLNCVLEKEDRAGSSVSHVDVTGNCWKRLIAISNIPTTRMTVMWSLVWTTCFTLVSL